MLRDLYRSTEDGDLPDPSEEEERFFDKRFYLENNPDLKIRGRHAYGHFIKFGRLEGRRAYHGHDRRRILNSRGVEVYDFYKGLAQRDYYFAGFDLDRSSDIDPLMHYFAWGHETDQCFTPDFDAIQYFTENCDIREFGQSPAIHYAEHGWKERRLTSKSDRLVPQHLTWVARCNFIQDWFDVHLYEEQLPWIRATTIDPISHYLLYGEAAGLRPNAAFDPRVYPRELATSEPHQSVLEDYVRRRGRIERGPLIGLHHPVSEDGLCVADVLPEKDWAETRRRTGVNAGALPLGKPLKGWPIDVELRSSAKKETPEDENSAFLERALELLKGRQLSLDMWDTIVHRDCPPDAIKLRTARHLLLTQWENLAPKHRQDHRYLFQLRRAAEAFVANQEGEYRFKDTMAAWLDFLGITETASIEELLEFEIQAEMASISANPDISTLIEKYGNDYILTSDFYHDRTALERIIDHAGVQAPKSIYVSSEYLCSKRSGRLFSVLSERENIDPRKILHIGDNYKSDLANARASGFQALHFDQPAHRDAHEEADRQFWQYIDGKIEDIEASLLELVGYDGSQPFSIEWLAIPVAGFILQIMETATKLGVDKVFFLSREGLFFREAYDEIASANPLELAQCPSSQDLMVSRRSTFAASLEAPTIDEFMRMWMQYSCQSLQAFLASLNFEPIEFKEAAADHGIDPEATIVHPWKDKAFLSFVADPSVRERLSRGIWQQKDDLTAYLREVGFVSEEEQRRFVVDIGWRGSIQDNLCKVSNDTIYGCYFGLESFLNRQARNSIKFGFLCEGDEKLETLVPEKAALEFLCNYPGGSISGYRDGVPARDLHDGEESMITEHVRPRQAKILKCLQAIAEFVRRQGLTSKDLRSLSRAIVDRYMRSPPGDIADIFSRLHHSEVFGPGIVQDVGANVVPISTVTELHGASLHAATSQLARSSRWQSSISIRSHVSAALQNLDARKRLHISTRLCAPKNLRLGQLGSPWITFAAPKPTIGSGGHRTIFNAANKLIELGAKVNVMFEWPPESDAQSWVGSVLDANANVIEAWDAGLSTHVAVATIDYSAQYVKDAFEDRAKTTYLVQDFEASFNPVSDFYFRAERSYTQTQSCFTVGRWLAHKLGAEYGISADSGGLGIDPVIYKEQEKITPDDQVALLYQPEKFRRSSELCLEAITLLKEVLPNVKVAVYGSTNTPELPFDYENFGLIEDLTEIAGLYARCKVGLCVSGTNPSRIPFEMMASGCVPVDIYRYNNLFDFGGGVLAYQSAQSISAALFKVLQSEDEREKLRSAGLKFMAGRTQDWETDIFATHISRILEGFEDADIRLPEALYMADPVIANEDENPGVLGFLEHQRSLAMDASRTVAESTRSVRSDRSLFEARRTLATTSSGRK